MEILIFIMWLLVAFSCICYIPFFRKSGIGTLTLTALFAVKVSAGIAYARFYSLPKYYAGADTWRFYRMSLDETKWLLKSPFDFFKDLFIYGYSSPGSIFSGQNTYWNDLKSNLIVKILALMNVATHNSYYADIILFNFLFLFGLVALFKLFFAVFPSQKWFIIVGVFLLPSALFWCSGIHKDGLILSATGLVIYAFYAGMQHRFSVKICLLILFCFLALFAMRNYVLFALLPAFFCWWLCQTFRRRPLIVFATVYAAGTIALFVIPGFISGLNFPAILASKQQEFLLLQGGSQVSSTPLEPTFSGFLRFFPQAADMAFFRPHINEVQNLSYLPAIAETVVLIALILISIIFSGRRKALLPVEWFLIFFSVSVLLICGYTIPFTGAVVRYRSFVLPLLITPLLCGLNVKGRTQMGIKSNLTPRSFL